jgi:hypothetical protein
LVRGALLADDPANRRTHLAPMIAVSASSGTRASGRTEPVWMNHELSWVKGRQVSLLQQAQMNQFKSQFVDLLWSN